MIESFSESFILVIILHVSQPQPLLKLLRELLSSMGPYDSRLNFQIDFSGDSAYAVPHTNKLRTRVTHIWGNRRRQLNRSAMEEPLPGRTALLITVSPVPGKYEYALFLIAFIFLTILFATGFLCIHSNQNPLFVKNKLNSVFFFSKTECYCIQLY